METVAEMGVSMKELHYAVTLSARVALSLKGGHHESWFSVFAIEPKRLYLLIN